jgi:hypothetical protein
MHAIAPNLGNAFATATKPQPTPAQRRAKVEARHQLLNRGNEINQGRC